MAERRTSLAKDEHMPDQKQTLLHRYGVARNHFEHARDPLISQQHYDLVKEQEAQKARDEKGSILERPLLPEFRNEAGAGQGQDTPPGSKQVRDEKSSPEYRPPEEMARAQDRKTHQGKMAEDQSLSEKYRAALVERYNREPAQEQDNEHTRDQDYSRGR